MSTAAPVAFRVSTLVFPAARALIVALPVFVKVVEDRVFVVTALDVIVLEEKVSTAIAVDAIVLAVKVSVIIELDVIVFAEKTSTKMLGRLPVKVSLTFPTGESMLNPVPTFSARTTGFIDSTTFPVLWSTLRPEPTERLETVVFAMEMTTFPWD